MAQAETVKKKWVYVVTGVDLGWDCVVGVFDFDKVTKEQLEKTFKVGRDSPYVIHEQTVENDTTEFDYD